MSFTATIGTPEKHQAWYKGVYVLSTVDETIKVTVSDRCVILWNMHATETSMCQLTYDRSFFEEYEFKPYEMTFGEHGLQIEKDTAGRGHKLYSFEINAKHLITVSKRPDKDTIKKFTMTIDNTATCPDSLMNRLLINIEMESLIVKEYSPLFKPMVYRPIIVDLQYKRRFLDVFGSGQYDNSTSLDASLINCFNAVEKELSQSLFNRIVDAKRSNAGRGDKPLNSTDEINYLNCDLVLIKNFVDNCNKNTFEDVKLELSSNKLVMTAFTKSIFKSNEILQNAINMSNTMNTLDLNNYCVFDRRADGTNNKIPSKLIVFKLKDFKNYISISNAWKSLSLGHTKSNTANTFKNISIWFCKPGEPILFEMNQNGIKAQLILVTDSTTSTTEDERHQPVPAKKENVVVVPQQQPQQQQRRTNSPLKLQLQDTQQATSQRISPLKTSLRVPSRTLHSLSKTSSVTANARKLFVDDDSDHNDDIASNTETASSTVVRGIKRKMSPAKLDRTETTVGWGHTTTEKPTTEKPPIPTSATPGSSQETTTDEELGPTQEFPVRGIFD